MFYPWNKEDLGQGRFIIFSEFISSGFGFSEPRIKVFSTLRLWKCWDSFFMRFPHSLLSLSLRAIRHKSIVCFRKSKAGVDRNQFIFIVFANFDVLVNELVKSLWPCESLSCARRCYFSIFGYPGFCISSLTVFMLRSHFPVFLLQSLYFLPSFSTGCRLIPIYGLRRLIPYRPILCLTCLISLLPCVLPLDTNIQRINSLAKLWRTSLILRKLVWVISEAQLLWG